MAQVQKSWLILFLFLTVGLLVSCTAQSGGGQVTEFVTSNPTPGDILSSNKDADIFLVNDIVYSNAQNIEWVNEGELKLGEEVAEISKQTLDAKQFNHGTASKLAVGTKIYRPSGTKGSLIYIAVVNGEEIRYLGLMEG